MSDDLGQELRAFEGSEDLANGDFSACIRGADYIEAQAAEIARLHAWRDAINDALTNWLDPLRDNETPKDALRRLVSCEVTAALDPAVSQAAADLVATARLEGMEEAAKIAEGEAYKGLYRTWPWWKNKDGSQGNLNNEDYLVKHCDKIATAIRAAAKEGKQ